MNYFEFELRLRRILFDSRQPYFLSWQQEMSYDDKMGQ